MLKTVFEKVHLFFSELDSTGWVLFFTFLAIIWYSWETRQLRKWQKRNVQMSIIELITNINKWNKESLRVGHPDTAYPTNNFGETLRKIYEEGKFDLRNFYIGLKKKDSFLQKIRDFFGRISPDNPTH